VNAETGKLYSSKRVKSSYSSFAVQNNHCSEVTMATGKKDASLASKQLANKKSTAAQKSVAGSDLTQAKKALSAKPKKK
jgi:hypothetical protein